MEAEETEKKMESLLTKTFENLQTGEIYSIFFDFNNKIYFFENVCFGEKTCGVFNGPGPAGNFYVKMSRNPNWETL